MFTHDAEHVNFHCHADQCCPFAAELRVQTGTAALDGQPSIPAAQKISVEPIRNSAKAASLAHVEASGAGSGQQAGGWGAIPRAAGVLPLQQRRPRIFARREESKVIFCWCSARLAVRPQATGIRFRKPRKAGKSVAVFHELERSARNGAIEFAVGFSGAAPSHK